MRGYFVRKGTAGWLITNNGEPAEFTTTKDQTFFQEQLVVDPVAFLTKNPDEIPAKYRKYNLAAKSFIHGFELTGNKELDTKYILLVKGDDIIIG